MNYKKFFASTLTIAALMVTSKAESAQLSAKVEKGNVEIAKMLEYNRFAEADAMLKKAMNKNPKDLEAKALWIVSLAKQYKLEPAQKQLDVLLKQNPENADLHYAQGVVYMKRITSSNMEYRNNADELIDKALIHFEKATTYDKNHYAAYNAAGVAALNLDNNEQAKVFFEKALEIDPTYSTAIDNLGTIDYLDGNLDEAEAKFNKSLKYNTKNPTAFYHLAQVAAKRGDYSKSVNHLNNSLALNPNSAVAYNLLGEVYELQGNEAAAINAFRKSTAIKPEETDAYVNLAEIYEKRSDNEFAIEQLKTAISADPQSYGAKLKIADIAFNNEDYKQALKYYSELSNVKTYTDEALKGVAACYYEIAKDSLNNSISISIKDLKKANEQLNQAICANPNDLELYLAKLKVSKILKEPKLSDEILTKIINSPAHNISDMLVKGEAYLALNKFVEAEKMFEEAVNSSETLEDDLYLAEIFIAHKNYPAAKLASANALLKDAQNDTALNVLKYINYKEAASEQYFKDAIVFKNKNNPVFTREYLVRSINANPRNTEALLATAKFFEKEDNYSASVRIYKEYLRYCADEKEQKAINKKIDKLVKKLNKDI